MHTPALNPYLPLDTYIPDGEPHVFNDGTGDRLYVYGSHDAEGGDAFCLLDYEVWSAPVTDLADWRCHGTAYRAQQDPGHGTIGLHMYAPDVVQGNDGRFYLYYSLSGKEAFTAPIHVAVADHPAGPYTYHGEVRNPDGTAFTRCLTFDPGLLNDDGTVYLYYGWSLGLPAERLEAVSAAFGGLDSPGFARQLREIQMSMFGKSEAELEAEAASATGGIMGANVVRLDDDMLTVIEGPTRIVPGQLDAAGTQWEGHAFFEASSMRKIGDTYYFIYSSQVSHELCYATSAHPDRDFNYGGVIISNGDIGYAGRTEAQRLAMTGNNHGSIVEVGDQWYVFYHRQTHKTTYSRQGCAEKIEILPDGSIPQVEMTSCGSTPARFRLRAPIRPRSHAISPTAPCRTSVLSLWKSPSRTSPTRPRRREPSGSLPRLATAPRLPTSTSRLSTRSASPCACEGRPRAH
ncbi:family 43 glycosylhydrolase [Actinomyces ruminis]|uniref:family 43 glycosylhydrolase n=1 Tax=Actinomyces ruminis TaxID=1937003 RepID=UPI001C557429|nr:family 43 glycosylhydrolase [Actinomyces ruminis]